MIHNIIYNGDTITLSIDDANIEKLYSSNKFHEQDLLESINIDGGTVVDCGACVGNHSIFIAKFTKADNVYAFEPVIDNYRHLIYNIVANSAMNIIPMQIGLSSTNAFNGFQLIKQGRWVQAALGGTGNIPVTTLDSYGFNDVTLIKIDVEGKECDVIKGAIETLSTYKPQLYVEAITPDALKSVMDLLTPLGYAVKSRYHKGNPTYHITV